MLDVVVHGLDAIHVPDSLAARLTLTAEASELALQLHDRVGLFWSMFQRTYAAIESGDAAEAQRCHNHTVALADEIGQPTMRWLTGLTTASLRLLGGDAAGAEDLATRTSSWGGPAASRTRRPCTGSSSTRSGGIRAAARRPSTLESCADRVPLPMFRAASASTTMGATTRRTSCSPSRRRLAFRISVTGRGWPR